MKSTHPLRGRFVIAKKRRTSEPHLFGGVMSQRCIEMEDQAMSLIQKGYAVSTRGGFLGALFSALLALALLHPGAAPAGGSIQNESYPVGNSPLSIPTYCDGDTFVRHRAYGALVIRGLSN